MKLNEEVSKYISKADTEQIKLLEDLRVLIHNAVPGTSEAIKWGFPVFAKEKDFTYLRFSKKHITLGFYNIAKIDDPDKHLEGSGNTLKHIKIRSKADINEELLSGWLKAISE